MSSPNLWQKLVIKLWGRTFLRYEIQNNWIKPLPFFLTKCGRHGYYEDYPHGEYDRLDCPGCVRETIGGCSKHGNCPYVKDCSQEEPCRLRGWTYVTLDEAKKYNVETKI